MVVVRFRWAPLTRGVVRDSGLLSCLAHFDNVGIKGTLLVERGVINRWCLPLAPLDPTRYRTRVVFICRRTLTARLWLADRGKIARLPATGLGTDLLTGACNCRNTHTVVLPYLATVCRSPSYQFGCSGYLLTIFGKLLSCAWRLLFKFVSNIISTKKREWNGRVGVILGVF